MPEISEVLKQVQDIMEDYQRLKEKETKKKDAIKKAKLKYYKKNLDKWKGYYLKRKQSKDEPENEVLKKT